MKLFYALLGAVFAIAFKAEFDRRRAMQGASPRRLPADRVATAEDEIAGPLSEV